MLWWRAPERSLTTITGRMMRWSNLGPRHNGGRSRDSLLAPHLDCPLELTISGGWRDRRHLLDRLKGGGRRDSRRAPHQAPRQDYTTSGGWSKVLHQAPHLGLMTSGSTDCHPALPPLAPLQISGDRSQEDRLPRGPVIAGGQDPNPHHQKCGSMVAPLCPLGVHLVCGVRGLPSPHLDLWGVHGMAQGHQIQLGSHRRLCYPLFRTLTSQQASWYHLYQ